MQDYNSNNNNKVNANTRLICLVVVLVVAFAGSIYGSIYSYINGTHDYSVKAGNEIILVGIIFEAISLAVLYFVLSNQERNLKSIGFSFKWSDIPLSVAIVIFSYIIFVIANISFHKIYFFINGHEFNKIEFKNPYIQSGLTIFSLMLVLINPFYEELIVRAYTITELMDLTNSKFIAIFFSSILQSLYHLYQGGASAFSLFLLFTFNSIYFAKTKRIWPLILAHLYFDLLALLYYSARK